MTKCTVCREQIDIRKDCYYTAGDAPLCSPECVFKWRGKNGAW